MTNEEGQLLPVQDPKKEVYDDVLLQLEEIMHCFVTKSLDLSPLKEAPNLKKLILQDCPGLMLVRSNFATLSYLKEKGVEIKLTNTPEFAKAWADYCSSNNTPENVLPHAIAAASPESAVLQGPSAQNQSPEEALPSYSTNHILS